MKFVFCMNFYSQASAILLGVQYLNSIEHNRQAYYIILSNHIPFHVPNISRNIDWLDRWYIPKYYCLKARVAWSDDVDRLVDNRLDNVPPALNVLLYF